MNWNLMPVLDLKMGLKWKTILGLGFLLTAALLLMGGVMHYQGMRLVINELLEKTGGNIEKDTLEIEEFIKSSKDDLMVMANTPPISGLIRARDNGGIDPLTGDKTEYWNARMVQIFSAFLRYHPEYYHLRYLDEKGNELVRVELIGKEIKVTPKEELQNKAQYPYFTEAMKLKENDVYYSEVNLDREHGVISIPHASTFRISTPVYDAQKRVRGIVVVNIVPEAMFAKIKTETGGTRKYLINQDGYFLVHPDKSKEFGFDLGFDYRITKALPEFAEEMKAQDFNVKYHAAENHIDSFKKIFFDSKNRNRYWAVVQQIPAAQAFKNISRARNMMFVVGFLIIVSSLIIITWIFTRRMVRPILKLAAAVTRIEHGDFGARVPEDGRKDELGSLALSANRMAAIIEKNLNELTILNKITIAATSTLSVQVMSYRVLDTLLNSELFNFEKKAAIFLADEKTRTLKLVASRGFSKEHEALDAVVPFGDCLCGMVAETGEPIISERCCDDPRHTRKYPGISSHGHIILPLQSGETVLGVLSLYLPADTKIAPEDIKFYRPIAHVIAVSLQNGLQFARIEKLESKQGLILNSMGEGLYELDTEGICTFINPTAAQMLGYESGELTGALLHAVTHHTRPDGSAYPLEECRIYASFKKNAVQHVDDEVFWRKDGSSFPVEYTSTPILDANSAAIGAVVVFSDITERKQLEEAVNENYERYLSLYEGIDDALFVHEIKTDGTAGNFLEVNIIACRRLGYSREELLAMTPADIDAPEPDTDLNPVVEQVMTGESVTFTQIHVTKDGRRIPVEIRSHIFELHGQSAVLSLARDITERRQLEAREYARSHILEALTSGKSLASILELITYSIEAEDPGALCSILLMDKEGKHLLNGAAPSLPDFYNQAIHGLEIGDGIGSCGTAAFTGQRVIVEDVLTHPYWLNFRDLTQKAGLRSCWSEPIISSEGLILGTFAIYHRDPRVADSKDIERIRVAADFARLAIERIRADQMLRERETRYRSLVTASAQIVWTTNAQGEVVDDLPTWRAYTGQSREEIKGWGWSNAVHPEDRERTAAAWSHAVEEQTLYDVEYRIRKNDGAYRLFVVRGVPVQEEDGTIREWVGTCTDITERRRSEQIMSTRLLLNDFAPSHSINELLQKALDEIELLTGSQIGFFHFMNADQHTLSLQSWSTATLQSMCKAEVKERHYDMEKAGVWADCARQRRPVIHNDYAALPHRKGLPDGHAPIIREMAVPVFRGDSIVAILGVGNKQQDYGAGDVEAVSLLADLTYDIIERKHAQKAIKEYAATLEVKVNERTSELKNAKDRLFAQKEKLRATLDNMLDCVITINDQGVVQSANLAVQKVLGYSSEELVGHNVAKLPPEPHRSNHHEYIARYLRTNDPHIIGIGREVEGQHKDGRLIPLELSISEFTVHGQRFFTGILRDISERKRFIVDLNQAKEAAEAANRAKSDFLANMSHELRTPLNAIIGFSDIMTTGLTGPLTDEQADFLNDIGSSGKHLLTLINDILDLSKVEAGKMELETSEFEVKELIERCLVMFKEKSLKHGIHVEYTVEDSLETIIADEMKLKQVIVNLLSNAFKFTPDGGSVRVGARRVLSLEPTPLSPSLSRGDMEGDFVEISVADNGPGISEADIPRLFQPFQQLETKLNTKKPGTGLGLNLCKKFVELHGGRIWIESEVGKGCRFLFVIPTLKSR